MVGAVLVPSSILISKLRHKLAYEGAQETHAEFKREVGCVSHRRINGNGERINSFASRSEYWSNISMAGTQTFSFLGVVIGIGDSWSHGVRDWKREKEIISSTVCLA